MQMANRVPGWVDPIAWAYIALSIAAFVYISIEVVRRRRGSTATDIVWATSALYLGPFAVPLYRRHLRSQHPSASDTLETGTTRTNPSNASAGLPGGSASAVAHLIGVPLVLASGLTIAGIDLWVMIIVIGLLAIALLFAYERATSRGRRLSVGAALGAATLTVLAFDIGMGGWMLLLHFNEYMPPATEGAFWFLMQIGVILGLLTGYPAVRWLLNRDRSAVLA